MIHVMRQELVLDHRIDIKNGDLQELLTRASQTDTLISTEEDQNPQEDQKPSMIQSDLLDLVQEPPLLLDRAVAERPHDRNFAN